MVHSAPANISSFFAHVTKLQPPCKLYRPETESKEKHGVGGPMPELTITSPFVDSRVDSNTCPMGNPMTTSSLALIWSFFRLLIAFQAWSLPSEFPILAFHLPIAFLTWTN